MSPAGDGPPGGGGPSGGSSAIGGGSGADARAAAAQAFVAALWGWDDATGDERLSGQFVTVVGIDGTAPDTTVSTRFVAADDPAAIAAEIVAADTRHGAVYLSVGATDAAGRAACRTERGGYRRPPAASVTAITGLWADIDVAGPGHEGARPYPPDREAARRLIDAMGPEPTLVVDTGGGLHAYWRLDEPWVFESPAERDEAAALARDWVSTLRGHAARLDGWDVDAVGDLARIMRAAGSTNRKGVPAAVRIVSHEPGRVYAPDDLREWLADDEVLAALAVPKTGPVELEGVDLQAVWALARSYRESPHGRYTPDWIAAMNENHDTSPLALAWADAHPSPDPSAVDASITRTVLDAGATLAQACEAIMCYHLRTDHKIDKVDPSRRTTYLVQTVGKFAASSREAAAARERRDVRDRDLAGLVDPTTPAVTPEPERQPEPVTPPPAQPADRPDPDPVEPETTEPEQAEPETPGVEPASRTEAAAHAALRDPDPRIEGDPADASPDRLTEMITDVAGAHIAGPDPDVAPVDDPSQVRFYETSPGDPWGERRPDEAELLDELTTLLLPRPMVDRGIKVWRLEHKDYGADQQARLVLSIPADFAWPTGERPGRYHPGQPMATEWRPRQLFEKHPGYHQALRFDVAIGPRPVAAAGSAPDPDGYTAQPGDWARVIDALVPYWRRDSSHTDLASATWEWLRDYLCDHPATTDHDDALLNRRPILARESYDPYDPPVVLISTRSLMEFIAVQPGGKGGRAAKGVLDYLALAPARMRAPNATRRARWAEVLPAQFDPETWGEIIECLAVASELRTESGWRRSGLRSVAPGERVTTATERMRLRSATATGEFAPEPDDGAEEP